MATNLDSVDRRRATATAAVWLVLAATVTAFGIVSTASRQGSRPDVDASEVLGPAPSVTASVPQPAEASPVAASAQRAASTTPVGDAHCAGFLFTYELAFSRIANMGVMPPEVASPYLVGCPRRMIVPVTSSDQAWCVGAASAVALFWPTSNPLTMAREIARTVDDVCMPSESWQLDPAMFGVGGLPNHPMWIRAGVRPAVR